MRHRFFSLIVLGFAFESVGGSEPAVAPTCANAAIHATSDYAYAIGSADFHDADGDPEAGSLFRWLKNGSVVISNARPVSESLLLHFDNAVTGSNGETPSQSQGIAYASGKWGQALALTPAGSLRFFPRQYNFDPNEGTVEMWAALRVDL
jgi:hypothetical protein